MIKVFVWAPIGATLGHAACDIHSGESRHLYASWWPIHGGEVKFGDRAHLNRTFANDYREEGRHPTYTIDLTGGFEDSAIRWWREGFLQLSPRWSLFSENCSWVVAQILKIAFPSGILDGDDAWNTIWTPMDVARYAWTIQRRLVDRQQPPGRTPTMVHNSLHRTRH
jgi:hypothetical protein